jgi:tetratricopeptide (TPR) repeat protein
MSTENSNNSTTRRVWIALAAVLLIAGGAIIWLVMRLDSNPKSNGVETASADDVEKFYVGVAALDVEANQRAVASFQDLSKTIPEEPAVWANLAIAHLRLNETPTAVEALKKAAALAPENHQIIMLQALVEERSGAFDQAIQRLRQISEPDAAALYMLASLVERTGGESSPRERLDLINRILQQHPQNMAAQFQRARLAARLEDASQLNEALDVLEQRRAEWSELATQQFASAKAAAESGQFTEAAKFLTFFENVSKSAPSYQESLLTLGVTGGSVGTPLREFVALAEPKPDAAEADLALTFQDQPDANQANPNEGRSTVLFLSAVLSDDQPPAGIALRDNVLQVGTTIKLPFPHDGSTAPVSVHAVLPVDLNADFRQDLVLVGSAGIAIHFQNEAGQFTQWTPTGDHSRFEQPGDGVWTFDFEADGDLDLLVAKIDGSSQLLRNNGDSSFTPTDALNALPAPRELHWIDLDNDGDGDLALLDRNNQLLVSWNERAGLFSNAEPLADGSAMAASAVGDLNQDGVFDVLGLDLEGALHQFTFDSNQRAWSHRELTQWPNAPDIAKFVAQRQTSLMLADLDNNGAIDIIASIGADTRIWLNDSNMAFHRLERSPSLFVTSVADVNGDGQLDLTGMSAEGGRISLGEGTKGYHWQVVRPRANPNAGDQRINAFALGGRIELRAGRLIQAAPIGSPEVHFGLGIHARAAVARIVWPNGSVQAEFDLKADQTAIAQQRLKGSCPFVFARNQDGLAFVKDFIWRSPLGLKINSQDTAGVNQTEDWIKIPGELLTPHDGVYELRITADLWETHFFDHVSLMAFDHPDTEEAFVDERFIASSPPELNVKTVTPPRLVTTAQDESGRDVSDALRAIDGVYVDSFKLGKFQGVAADHWVAFTLPDDVPTNRTVYLVGHGWIYPTDSSLNVAMSQGDFARPYGLILEAAQADGSWRTESEDLGFPAGKNKTVLIALTQDLLQSGQKHFRLRTNLEVYWDYLGWAEAPETEKMETTRLAAQSAELRYRGFSDLTPLDRRKPDLPLYDRLAGFSQRWRDLEGYYTRFGDVRELLNAMDDRYVIMNAGDEMVLKFAAPNPPRQGWKRSFVLIGDGWVKDGDFNTTHSRTVHPLPTHSNGDYSAPSGELYDDPVYQTHQEDWRRFHTRYVAPHHFGRGLWPAQGRSALGDDS